MRKRPGRVVYASASTDAAAAMLATLATNLCRSAEAGTRRIVDMTTGEFA
ncbi:hypothetical protein [Lysobacter sp. CA199]